MVVVERLERFIFGFWTLLCVFTSTSYVRIFLYHKIWCTQSYMFYGLGAEKFTAYVEQEPRQRYEDYYIASKGSLLAYDSLLSFALAFPHFSDGNMAAILDGMLCTASDFISFFRYLKCLHLLLKDLFLGRLTSVLFLLGLFLHGF